MTTRERKEVGEREAGFEQPQSRAQHVGVGRGVAGRAVALLRDDQALTRHRVEQRCRDAHAHRELVEGEQLGVAGLRAGDRGGERDVGGVELTGEEPADHRQREALPLEVLDGLQPVDVVGAVPGDAPGPTGRREQLALLVEADGVDGDLGPAGQLLDPDLRVSDGGCGPHGSHERRF